MEFLYISFGSLLAVLTPIISSRFSIHFQREEIKKAINSELDNLRLRMARLSFRMTSKYGNFNREFLVWFKEQVQDTNGLLDLSSESKTSIEELISSNEYRQNYIATTKSEKFNSVLSAKYSLPFIESKLDFTQHLEISYTRKILNILGHLKYFNEIVDESRWFFRQTFDTNMTKDNWDMIQANLDRSYSIIGERAREIATEISSLE